MEEKINDSMQHISIEGAWFISNAEILGKLDKLKYLIETSSKVLNEKTKEMEHPILILAKYEDQDFLITVDDPEGQMSKFLNRISVKLEERL